MKLTLRKETLLTIKSSLRAGGARPPTAPGSFTTVAPGGPISEAQRLCGSQVDPGGGGAKPQ